MVSTLGLTTVRLEASSSFRAWMNWLTGARLAEGVFALVETVLVASTSTSGKA